MRAWENHAEDTDRAAPHAPIAGFAVAPERPQPDEVDSADAIELPTAAIGEQTTAFAQPHLHAWPHAHQDAGAMMMNFIRSDHPSDGQSPSMRVKLPWMSERLSSIRSTPPHIDRIASRA